MGRYTLATMFGVGLVKKAPGTAGSAVAALLAWFILGLPLDMVILTGGTFLFTVWGTKSATKYMVTHGSDHDPKEIVVDELAGQWLTYVIGFKLIAAQHIARVMDDPRNEQIAEPARMALANPYAHLVLIIVLGFLLFRLFDILKPWPISLADRNVKGGFGVMFDDLLAAIPAGILLAFLYPHVTTLFV